MDGLSGSLVENDPPPISTATSDAEGRFQLVLPTRRAGYARVEAGGRSPALVVLPIYAVTRAEPSEDGTLIALRPAATLSVRVTGSAPRRSAGIEVRLSTASVGLMSEGTARLFLRNPAWQESGDEQGSYRFKDLPSEVPLCIEVVRNARILQRETAPLLLGPGEHRNHSIELGLARIEGQIEQGSAHADRSLSGTRVRLFAAGAAGKDDPTAFDPWSRPIDEVTVDPSGRFKFIDVPVGEWRLEAGWPYQGGSPPSTPVSVIQGQAVGQALLRY